MLNIIFYSSHCAALFCPSGFNQMNIGDTLQQVQTQCGKPASEKKYKSTANVPQEWSYYMPMDPNLPGTMKLVFAFVNNSVESIMSNGIGVGGTTICNGVHLQIGSTTEDVKKACGTPAIITQTNLSSQSAQGTPAMEIVEWRYNSSPPETLIFENGKLKERKQ